MYSVKTNRIRKWRRLVVIYNVSIFVFRKLKRFEEIFYKLELKDIKTRTERYEA